MATEIERKYLPQDPNWRPTGTCDRMVQGYFFLGQTATAHVRAGPRKAFTLVLKPRDAEPFEFKLPAQDGTEILAANPHYIGKSWTFRVRHSGKKGGFLTLKGPRTGIACPEYEYKLNRTQVNKLLALCPDTHIIKDRYEIPYKGYTWEVDVYHGHLAPLGLVTCEVELKSEQHSPPLPSFVGRDISHEKAYANLRLAMRGKLPFHPAAKGPRHGA